MQAHLVRRADRDAVLAYLEKDVQENLFLLDMALRHGRRPAPGEMRTELAVATRAGDIVGVAGLRPSVVFDAAVEPEAVTAFIPFLETLGVGLVKSGVAAVDQVWGELQRRSPRSVILDRHEIVYTLHPGQEVLVEPEPGVCVRPAAVDDLEALVVAARESLREEGRPDPFAGDVRSFRRWVRGRVPRARVVEQRGRIAFVGYADVQRPEGWLIQGVYTWPELRGRGLAQAGVSDLCRDAFVQGGSHVQLAVVEGNAPGIALYEKLGFKATGRLRTILFTDG
ncbi:MAG: GNAT family N-acetyltransferase [Myxococcota bacterium]